MNHNTPKESTLHDDDVSRYCWPQPFFSRILQRAVYNITCLREADFIHLANILNKSLILMPSSAFCISQHILVEAFIFHACIENQIEGLRPDGSRLGRGLAEASPP